MKHASPARRIEAPHSYQNNIDHGCAQKPLTQEMIRVLVVAFSAWVAAAITLVYFGKFDLVRLMLSVGFITSLLMVCSGMAVLIASVARYMAPLLERD
ncbi:hypothetical protein [Microvirga sp. G4-2]|uniref:hypothetical protein n=1 Tax=Microvirga sp. G4-2 TaxID=3434467 RepID=UPI004044E68F